MTVGEVKTLLFADGVVVTAPSPVTVGKTITDTTGWTGSATSVTYTVTSADVPDARTTVWIFKNSSYKQILADISSADATHVTVAVDEPLPAGTYYLTGVF